MHTLYSRLARRAVAGSLALSVILMPLVAALPAQAAVSNWQNGFSMVPSSPSDFGSDTFKQSLQNMRATGANTVSLVIPYYQSNTGSTDINPGANTPTMESLATAIDYAHGLGMSVTLKFHVEVYDGSWRAYINPGDRATWFQNYGNALAQIAGVAAAHRAEMIVIGTEMVSMAASSQNSTNTQNWINLIGRIRGVYNGKLTYSANSNSNSDNPFVNEKKYIGFWSYLDYVGLSAYYNLNTGSNDVNSLMAQWDYWNTNDLQPFSKSVNKPLLFVEVGYRSLQNAHQDPWNWQRGGSEDQTEQANDYQAFLQYWNNYSYVAGASWWDWSTNPNAGWGGTDYTPQHKQAEQIVKKWFTNPTAPSNPNPSQSPAFTSSATSNPGSPGVGSQTSVAASITNTGSAFGDGIIDIEIYDKSGAKVYQQFFEHQNIAAGEVRNYTVNWVPGAAGTYTVMVGEFNNNWSKAYGWNSNALTITVAGSTTPPPPNNPPPTNPPPTNPPPTNNPPPPTGGQTTEVWWPSDGSSVTGVQPFKAMVQNLDVSQYNMWWQVDGGQLNQMSNSSVDYPHKEALVNLTGWNWKGSGPYQLTFVSKDNSGKQISTKSVNINIK
ncbi:MAG: hypothetical protein JWO43_361 [Candidatus Adlerbacteria bacterium]|nr:hypothetical protein [Candidatus Adlerbacteria bacterium]